MIIETPTEGGTLSRRWAYTPQQRAEINADLTRMSQDHDYHAEAKAIDAEFELAESASLDVAESAHR